MTTNKLFEFNFDIFKEGDEMVEERPKYILNECEYELKASIESLRTTLEKLQKYKRTQLKRKMKVSDLKFKGRR